MAGEGQNERTGQGDRRLDDRDLQHTASFAFLTGLTRFAMLGGTFHVVAAVLPHTIHHRHAHGFHRAWFSRCLNTRHPTEGKRQANQENQAKPQITFHGLKCRRCKWPLQFTLKTPLLAVTNRYAALISISGLKVPNHATRQIMMTAIENSSVMLRRKALTATEYSPLRTERSKSGLR